MTNVDLKDLDAKARAKALKEMKPEDQIKALGAALDARQAEAKAQAEQDGARVVEVEGKLAEAENQSAKLAEAEAKLAEVESQITELAALNTQLQDDLSRAFDQEPIDIPKPPKQASLADCNKQLKASAQAEDDVERRAREAAVAAARASVVQDRANGQS